MIGQTISHYRITAKLGEGGMGAVYQAEDLKLQRPVALKFLTSELAAEPQGRERLLMEARAASRLNHPNIATIYEVGETENLLFIAMELVTGETLKDIMRRGVLPASQLLDLARQIAKINELRVFPRSAVFGYRDKPVTAPQIGQQLNAPWNGPAGRWRWILKNL